MKIKYIALALLLSSCGYSIKSDKEIEHYKSSNTFAQDELNIIKQQNEEFQSDMIKLRNNDLSEFEAYKDSVEFDKLTRIMCYNNNPHRHSCEIYK